MKGLLASPMPMLNSLRNEMDRIFDRAWDGGLELPRFGEYAPTVDLSETDEAISVRVEVPGIEPNDIHVQLQGQSLTIRGEKRRETQKSGERFYRTEREYGTFVRVLQLPCAVREDKVSAVFKNGLLTVTLAKVPEAAGTTIPVRAAS